MLFGSAARFPLGGVKPDYLFGRLAKGRCLAGAGVAAFCDGLAVSESPSAGFGECDCRVATQPQVGVSAVDLVSLCPGFGESPLDVGWFDQQAQSMAGSAVAIASGLGHCSNESCCECWWSFHPCFSLSADPENVR